MVSPLSPNPVAQQGILRAIKALTVMPAQVVLYGSALLAIAATGGTALPGILGTIATSVGVNVLANMLERIARGENVPSEEIRKTVEEAIHNSDIETLATSNEFQRAIARVFRQFDLLKYAVQRGELNVVAILTDQFTQHTVLLEELQSDLAAIRSQMEKLSTLDQTEEILTLVRKISDQLDKDKQIDFESFDNLALSKILPTISTESIAQWISAWGEDSNTTILTKEQIRILLESGRLPKSSSGFGKAVRKSIERGAGYTSTVFLPGSTYPFWEVKYDCVRSVISLDDASSLRVLASFSTMSYWKARDRIIDYIKSRYDDKRLSHEDTRIALGILTQIVTDGKTSEKTPMMRKAHEMLQKLQQSFKEI